MWCYFIYFFSSRKIWGWPKQSEVLIYDACNSNILLEYLRPWHPEVLHVRGEQIYMGVFFSSLFRGGIRSDAYTDCFIEKVCPRLIITFIDNSSGFHSISVRHQGVKTLFIQNGMRGEEIFERLAGRKSDEGSLKVDYMMTFGSCVGAEYAKYIQGCVVPMGSILNNSAPEVSARQQGTIVFVSQWIKTGLYAKDAFYTQEESIEQVDFPVVQCLVNYARGENKRLMIIPRSSKYDNLRVEEEAYFQKLAGCELEFLEPGEPYSSYQALDMADVVVTIDSTLGYESLARGRKTAIFSTRSALLRVPGWAYGWPGDFPDEGPFWTNNPDPDSYVRILDYLFEVDDVQWRKDVESTNFSLIMRYNPGNTILRSTLEKVLGSHPASRD